MTPAYGLRTLESPLDTSEPGLDAAAAAARAAAKASGVITVGAAGLASEQPAVTAVVSPEARREVTVRALLLGCGIGALLAAGNVYTGLKTSFIDGGSITAALLGFMFFATFKRLGRTPYLALENNITQTTAASAAVMSFVVGISGPVPALGLMGHHYSAWALSAWGIALGCIGIVLAGALRRKLVVADQLPFPTGVATAEVIETIYAARATALRRARLLVAAAAAAMVFTWFRDARPAVFPQITLFGTTLFGLSTAAFSLGVSWSPLMVSTGMIMGLRNAASMLAGAALSWGVVAPWLVRAHIVPSASFGTCISWLVWPALGLLTAGSFVPLVLEWRAVARSFRDLPALLRGKGPGAAADEPGARLPGAKLVLLACVGGLVWVGWKAFGLHPLITLFTVLLGVVLATIAARAAGETDIAPIGAMGMLTQLVFAGFGPVVSLLSASMSSGKSSQAAQTLWALKTGERLKATPRSQLGAQLLGAVLGGLVVVPVYLVIVKAYGLGTQAMPAPAAISWKATAEAVRGGIAAMPAHGPLAGAIGFAAGVVLALLSRTRAGRFVPAPAAMGVAALNPAALSVAAFGGAVLIALVRLARPKITEASVLSVAAGGIAGESLMGVLVAVLLATGLL